MWGKGNNAWGGAGMQGGWGGGGGNWGNQNKGGATIRPANTAPKPAQAPKPVAAKPTPVQPTAGVAVKKPITGIPTAAGTPGSASSAGGKGPVFTVSTNSLKKDEIGVQTLVGDYTEVGTNHTRKYYQKSQEIPGHKDVKVFLYYWDMRDGADFAGWWFGDELGGSQVWARCSAHGNVPPPGGWKIPWDAPKAEPGLLTVNPYKAAPVAGGKPALGKPAGKGAATAPGVLAGKGAATAPGALAGKGAANPSSGPAAAAAAAAGAASMAARVKTATEKVVSIEKSSAAAAAKAKVLNKDSAEGVLKTTQTSLTAEQNRAIEAQKSLTADINEARKAGPTAVSSVTELSKLSPRLRTASASINMELNKIKGFISVAEAKKKNAASQEQQKEKEEKQAKELEDTLPLVQEMVSAAEDAVEAVDIMAAPIINDPPADAGVSLKKVMDDIESQANAAQTHITSTRAQINTKLTAARLYAPEARKTALAEFTELQNKLGEAQKKLNPFKNFKKEFSARVEAKKALTEIVEKLGNAELEAEKAAMMTTGADESQMSEEDVKSAEELVKPAREALTSVGLLVQQKLKQASGPMREELVGLQKRLTESQKKVNEVSNILKRQQEGLSLQSVYATAHEKVDKAEESLDKCGEAELSFLKGIEVLPADESDKAIKESEAAASASTQLVAQASNFLRQKLQEVKRYSPETAKKATTELMELQNKCDAVQKKLTTFKTETQERKVAALMSEAIDAVGTAEKLGRALTEAAKVFNSDNLENTSAATIKTASEKTSAASKACGTAMAEARKVLAVKQREAKDKATVEGLAKLSTRLNTVQQEISRIRTAAAVGERLVKGKETIVEAEAKLVEVEAEVEKVVKMSKPEDDGLGVETISDDSLLGMEATCIATLKSLRSVTAMLNAHLATAPAAIKASMTKLLERSKKADSTIAEVRAGTKDQREQVLGKNFVKEGLEKTLAVEAALDKVAEAELPYLKGIEVLPVDESKAAMKAADETSQLVGAAIGSARTAIASKNIELRKFDAKNVKASLDEFTKLTERVNAAAQKLGVFKKDTEGRRKKAQMQEAAAMISSVQAEVEQVSEAMKPIMEKDPDTLSPEEAASMIKTLEDLEKSANLHMNEARTFLAARSIDARGDAEKTKYVQELQAKLTTALQELGKAKKLSGSHNDKLRAKALVQEAADTLKAVEVELEKATSAAAPVLEEKCERFLVKNSIATMCAALTAHMEEKSFNHEKMWKEMGKKLTLEKFSAFAANMAEALKREECFFSEARRAAMFKSINVSGDGVVSLAEFSAMFERKYTCVSAISVTDVFDIGASKTICKLEAGQVVDGIGAPKKAEGEGTLPRLQCKVSSGESGWVTVSSNQGTKYLQIISPFNEFVSGLEKELNAHVSVANKSLNFFTKKTQELASIAKDSPLQPAKEELFKVRSKVVQLQQKLDALKKRVQASRADYTKLEFQEKNAHLEAKEQKEADAITVVAKPSVEKVEAELVKLEEAAKPLTERHGTDLLQEFATPLSVQDAVKAIQTTLNASVTEAKAALKEQQLVEAVSKAVKGPMLEAKRELQRWTQKVSQAQLSANKVANMVKGCCNTVANAKFQLAASSLQEGLQAAGSGGLDALFKKLSKGKDRISEDAFIKCVSGLEGLDLPTEHAILLTRQIEVGGIGRRSFMRFLQKYFKVVKEIAITPTFDIVGSKEKPVRKAELDEVFEVIEGPKLDEASGLERVKVRALLDGAEGWVSVKGNQGKIFLTDVAKPFYQCLKDVALEKDFGSGSAQKGTVKAEEVLELIEGPRKESLGSVMRVRGKAIQDGKIGWFTMKDKSGTVFAEKGNKCYTCTATVAITDVFDIKACKVLKKLAVDEVFTISEGPTIEESSGISRVKCKSSLDDVEGWVTVKGNAGTVYAKVNEKLYTVMKEVSMQKTFASDSEAIRSLSAGEAFEVMEGPREERFVPANRAKVRTSSDEGWISVKPDNIKSWTPFYKFSRAGTLYASKGSKESVLREVTVGEILEMQEGPVEIDGKMWLSGKMKKDNTIGWTVFKDDAGAKILVQGQ